MAYRQVYFRIHTKGYSSGWSSDADRSAFKEESRQLLRELGWTIKLGHNTIYRWSKRYDGTLKSPEDRSHRPHSHPNRHRPEEIKLIQNLRRRNPNAGLVVLWVKLRQRGYTRSISSLYRFLRKSGQMAVKLPNPKYISKPYEQMRYPGQRERSMSNTFRKVVWSVPLPNRTDTTSTPFWMNTAASGIWRPFKSTAPILLLNSSGTASENSPMPLSVFRPTTVLNLPTG